MGNSLRALVVGGVACGPKAASRLNRLLLDSGYSDKAIKYFIEKPYLGAIPDADQVSEMTGACGDTMRICLRVENGLIRAGCPGAVASTMAVVNLIKGKMIADARTVPDGDVFRILENIPEQKHHCIHLAVKTLQKALDEHIQQSD